MAVAQRRSQSITTTTGGSFNLANHTTGSTTIIDGHTSSQDQNVYGATGPFTIKLGTGHTNNVYFTGGDQSTTSITGLAGNDSVFLRGGSHGTYTMNLGTGSNTLSLGNGWGSVAYTNTNAAASTYDTLDMSNVSDNGNTISLLATTGAVVSNTSNTIADVHSFRELKLGAGSSTVTLNNLSDTVTFGNGQAAVTGGTGNDAYKFTNFTGTADVTHTIADAAGTNTLNFNDVSSNVAVTFTSATGGAVHVAGTGAGAGHMENATFSGTTGIANVIGGSGNDTYTFGNAAGSHSLNGGLGSNTMVYNGTQSISMDVRDHELTNVGATPTTDITFHGFDTYKILGSGSNNIIGDGGTGATYYFGNGTSTIDTLGGASTIHNDMGGQTSVVLADGYGAMTVTNTAVAGNLTVDASAITASMGTVTLGVGSGSAQVDNSAGDSVTWAATSTVTGFIGNDQATTVSAVGNLNFHVTTGAGGDTITASGTGSSVINSGDGNDTVTVGNGANTVIFGGGTDTLTAGTGNNTVFTGSGTGTETVGAGNNVLDFSNGGTHTVTTGAGDNVLQGFTSNNAWTVGITNTMADVKGTLDLSAYNKADVIFDDQHNLNAGNVADLQISLDASHVITIHDYFDHSAATAAGSAFGTGAIKTLHFADGDLTFANVKALTTTSAFL